VAALRGGRLEGLGARVRPGGGGMVTEGSGPGVVVAWDRDPRVSTTSGYVELVEVAPAGRRRMSGAEWARGARIQPGERLG